jgi:hypothetical protein
MSLASYLSLMVFGTVAAIVSLVVATGVIDPQKTNSLGFLLVYGSLFAVVAGIISIFGFLVRFGLLRQSLASQAVVISFRQAFLLAFLVVAVFYLFANNLFSWLNLIALIVGLAGLEFFIISLRTKE